MEHNLATDTTDSRFVVVGPYIAELGVPEHFTACQLPSRLPSCVLLSQNIIALDYHFYPSVPTATIFNVTSPPVNFPAVHTCVLPSSTGGAAISIKDRFAVEADYGAAVSRPTTCDVAENRPRPYSNMR